MKTKAPTPTFRATEDVIADKVRVPVVEAKPGLLSVVGALKLEVVTADTDMVPNEPMAGAPFAADETASSITNPAEVWVPTLNVPAAWLLRTFQEVTPPAVAAAVQVTEVAVIAALAPAVVHVQMSLVFVTTLVPQLAVQVAPVLQEVNARERKYPRGVVNTNFPPTGTELTGVKANAKVPVVACN